MVKLSNYTDINIYINLNRMIKFESTKRSTGMATIREKETRQTQTYLGGGD